MLDGTLPSGTWIADAHGKSGSSRNASWASAGYVGANAPVTTAVARTSRPVPRTAAGCADAARGQSAPPRAGPSGPAVAAPGHRPERGPGRLETRLPLRPFRPVVWRSPVRTVLRRPSPGPLAGTPARHGGCSSAGRAPGCGPGGRGFKSRHPPQVRGHVDHLARSPGSVPGAAPRIAPEFWAQDPRACFQGERPGREESPRCRAPPRRLRVSQRSGPLSRSLRGSRASCRGRCR